jgi:Aldo/keto reductase family
MEGNNILEHPIIISVAEKLGKTPAQIALRWGIQSGHSVLPKSTSEARIRQNLDLFGWSIPDDLFSQFSHIHQASLKYICHCLLRITVCFSRIWLLVSMSWEFCHWVSDTLLFTTLSMWVGLVLFYQSDPNLVWL